MAQIEIKSAKNWAKVTFIAKGDRGQIKIKERLKNENKY